MDLREIGCEDGRRIELVQWQALVLSVLNLRVLLPESYVNCLVKHYFNLRTFWLYVLSGECKLHPFLKRSSNYKFVRSSGPNDAVPSPSSLSLQHLYLNSFHPLTYEGLQALFLYGLVGWALWYSCKVTPRLVILILILSSRMLRDAP